MPGAFARMTVVMEFDCTAEPMPNDAMAANSAKSTAPAFAHAGTEPSGRVNARSHAYMAPPSISPPESFTRYLTEA